MTHTWNYRITFKTPDRPSPDVTVQNASNLESALAMAYRYVIGYGPSKIILTEVKHRWGWEKCMAKE